MAPVAVTYVYDVPLPTQWTAAVQILSTCHALAASGVPTTVCVRSLEGTPAECLAAYGLEPCPNLVIRPFYSGIGWWLSPSRALRKLFAKRHSGRTQVVISRGDSAVELLQWLPPEARRPALFVYEAHRLTFAHTVERETGRQWDGTLPESGVARDLYAAEKTTVETADGVVCLTEGVRDSITRLFSVKAPILILPSGTRVSDEPRGIRDLDIVYAGKLMVRKGVPLLLEAMRHLPGHNLHVLGGSVEEVAASQALIRGDELESRVHFTGFVEPRLVRSYLARARVGVCPLPPGVSVTSDRFTSSLKVLELMAAGTPVVASDLPSIRSLLTHGQDGWLVPPGDAVALAKGVQTVLDDDALAAALVASASARVREFSWPLRARRLRTYLEDLAEQAVGSNGSARHA